MRRNGDERGSIALRRGEGAAGADREVTAGAGKAVHVRRTGNSARARTDPPAMIRVSGDEKDAQLAPGGSLLRRARS